MKTPRLGEKLCPKCERWGCLFNTQEVYRPEERVTPRGLELPWSTIDPEPTVGPFGKTKPLPVFKSKT